MSTDPALEGAHQDPVGDVWLRAGQAGRPHGVHGTLYASIDLPPDILKRCTLRLNSRHGVTSLHRVVEARMVHNGLLLSLAGVNSRELARLLGGATIDVRRGDVPQPADGEYYLYELQGAVVLDEAHLTVGTVTRIDDNGGQLLLVLASSEGERLLPLVPAIARHFDRRRHLLHVSVPAGLWE